MKLTQLTAISPIDGRYGEKLSSLQPLFSEFGLMHNRVLVEIRWLEALANNQKIIEISKLTLKNQKLFDSWITHFSEKDAKRIKTLEKKTNHDVKAVEYFIKEKLQQDKKLSAYIEFVHFACTSEDINNVAYALSIKNTLNDHLMPTIKTIIKTLQQMAHKYAKIPMISRTHGQPATPTTLGKELANTVSRLKKLQQQLASTKISAKFNGAVGNYNAHCLAYPNINWEKTCKRFVNQLGLEFNAYTTQTEPHDYIAEIAHTLIRFNTILTDLCRDIWHYCSLNYFTLKINKNETGSSTMPHKVNPINFENAEGNLGISNALFEFFATKLPISRLQRDLSDSTVLRNLGVCFAHSLLAYFSIEKGLNKLEPNKIIMQNELNDHWEVLAEPIQTVMRKYGIEKPYEKLKALTRGQTINQKTLHAFIDSLAIPSSEKIKLKKLTPKNYLGLAESLAKKI